jgi:outer membrane murein-binding lipoprotein Lpp
MHTSITSGLARPRFLSIGLVSLVAAAALLAGCGDKKDQIASQTAAKVNKDELTVHQINFLLQQWKAPAARSWSV